MVVQVTMLIFDFLGHFWRENGVATMRAHNGLGPPNPTKNLANWVDLLLFWANRYLEIMFSKFSGVNPQPRLSPAIIAAWIH